jgi:NDP-sugar pyrophosphorylase family protein
MKAVLLAEKPETRDGSCVSVWPVMLAEGAAVYGYELRGYIRDVGSAETLEAANRDLVAGAIAW